jgi:hypothetical protein
MAMGFWTSGSDAKAFAMSPLGSRMLAAAASAGISVSSDIGSLLNNFGNSAVALFTCSRIRIQRNERITKLSVEQVVSVKQELLFKPAVVAVVKQ